MRQPAELDLEPALRARVQVEGHELRPLAGGWEAASAPPELTLEAGSLPELSWLPAQVPGTAAGAMRGAGLWRAGQGFDFDAQDWWFRKRFDAEPPGPGEELVLRFDGIATVAEVYLNGELVLESDSMFASHELPLDERIAGANELLIRCRALAPLLRARRRPRARWRTRLVHDGGLRFFRTMLLGRAPGFAAEPAAVGPWRPVSLELRRGVALEELTLRPSLRGEDGVLSVRVRVRALDALTAGSVEVQLGGPSGEHSASLAVAGDGAVRPGAELLAEGELVVPHVARWWPHTHGEPVLHAVRLLLRDGGAPVVIDGGHVGFRELAGGSSNVHELERDGLDLHVNGVPVFARGAVWTPPDLVGLDVPDVVLRERLTQVRDAGMNMLRIPGTAAYERQAFHELCDELGILVWQDLMFANLDYPIADEAFATAVRKEVAEVLEQLGGRPSLAVLCGNSEIEQQVAMLGLDPSLGRGELFGELLPQLVADSGIDAVYVPSAPCGGELPFRPDSGIANYYGVGSYRRGLEDARHAGVRFAAECLAFSNVPDAEAIAEMQAGDHRQLTVNDPAWKAGIPRDAGQGFDFEDVRDHYLQTLYEIDPAEVRSVEHERYLEFSRMLTGEVMAEVLGEWRRDASPCRGALVLWLGDILPGAGWGLLDHRGEPKAAFHHVRRALAPVAVWTVDEGLGGIVAHVANDRPAPLTGELRVALYREGEHLVDAGSAPVSLAPHSQAHWDLESVLGHFVDIGWAFRFGPPGHHAVIVSLAEGGEEADEAHPLSQAVRFPARRPLHRELSAQLGLTGRVRVLSGARLELELELLSRRLAYGVRVELPGFRPDDDCFTLEPGRARVITLRSDLPEARPDAPVLTALNMRGRVKATLES